MIGGILIILVAIWVFGTATKAKTGNVIYWTAGAATLFLVMQYLFIQLNIIIIDGYGSNVGGEYDRDLTDIGARVTSSGGLQEGFFGTILGVLFEIMPPFMGWLSVAFVRTKFMLKQDLNLKNLVSGILDMFVSIKNSFKAN